MFYVLEVLSSINASQ